MRRVVSDGCQNGPEVRATSASGTSGVLHVRFLYVFERNTYEYVLEIFVRMYVRIFAYVFDRTKVRTSMRIFVRIWTYTVRICTYLS